MANSVDKLLSSFMVKFLLFADISINIFKKSMSMVLLNNSSVKSMLSRQDLSRCPICSSEDIIYFSTNGRFRLYNCVNCTHKFVGNPWSDRKLSLHYQGELKWHLDRNHQGIHSVDDDDEWRSFTNARWDTLISNNIIEESQSRNIRLLEIGCAEGRLLAFLKEKGYDVIGCEVNSKIAMLGQEKLGVEIVNKPIEDCSFADCSFDIICSFHAFEHLRDPLNILEKCKRLLKANGKILLELPVGEEELSNRDHLHFFSVSSGKLMVQNVFNNVSITNSWYVTCKGIRVESVYLAAQNI